MSALHLQDRINRPIMEPSASPQLIHITMTTQFRFIFPLYAVKRRESSTLLLLTKKNEHVSLFITLFGSYRLIQQRHYWCTRQERLSASQQHRTFETFLLKIMSPCYFREGKEPLARFSLVSAASLSTCITRAFCFLLSSILDGLDSGRFWWTYTDEEGKQFGHFYNINGSCVCSWCPWWFSPQNLRTNSYVVVIHATTEIYTFKIHFSKEKHDASAESIITLYFQTDQM